MLGSVLNLCAETLNQIINGITPTFSKFNISTELQSALLEQPNLSSKLLASVKQDHSKAHIVVKTEVYKKPLTERYLRSALMMIFDLYDALDSIINANHAAIVDGDPETKDSKESTTDKTAIPFQNVTTRGRSITNDDGPPEYDVSIRNNPRINT